MHDLKMSRRFAKDFNMWNVCRKMVPKLLSDQRDWCMRVCQDILVNHETEPDLLEGGFTCYESWILEAKCHNL